MTNEKPDNRIRPSFVVILCLVLAGLAALLWLFSRVSAPPQVANTAPPVEVEPVTTAKALPVSQPISRKPSRKRSKTGMPEAAPAFNSLEEQWGIQVSSLRLSMANSIVDLRYKVLNPEKAALLGNGKTAAYIFDHATGKKLIMPSPPKEGAFPPTSHKLVGGRTYFSMVSNQGGALKSGSLVTVIIGNSQATNLIVE